jgi:hypothetical protein
MGYTHYWTHPDNPAYRQAWPQLVQDAARIITAVTNAGITLAGPAGSGLPRADRRGVCLNGSVVLGQAYEAFIIWPPADTSRSEDASRRWKWDFCKTARQPYDLAVCAILLRFHLILPGGFLISSDGSWDAEWNQPVPGATGASQPNGTNTTSPRQLVADLFGPVPEDSQLSRIT